MSPGVKTTRSAESAVGLVVGLILALASAIIPSLDTGAQIAGGEEPSGSASLTATGHPNTTDAQTLLEQLVVAQEAPREGYTRAAFKHWVDADGDGCDTREEVLIEESLVPATQGPGCSVTAGAWFSPYDAVTFVAPGGLDIDHLVPLGEAWDSGASSWDSSRRQGYANDLDDPEALIAVSAGSNRSKGDRDPADWKPPSQSYWCRYAWDWVAVKIHWELSADAAEVDALSQMLETCESEPT